MSVHRIRLAGPWERQSPAADAERVRLPCPLSGEDSDEQLARRFHRPHGLSDTTRVRVVLTLCRQDGRVALNGNRLSPASAAAGAEGVLWSADVTDQLQPFNVLSVCSSDGRPLTVYAASLEIEEAAETKSN